MAVILDRRDIAFTGYHTNHSYRRYISLIALPGELLLNELIGSFNRPVLLCSCMSGLVCLLELILYAFSRKSLFCTFD